jgi:hypothetical protein
MKMPLIQFIQHNFPQAYWSAGFIACLIVVMTVSAVLYIITRWPAWIFTFFAAAVYGIPFFLYQY